MVKKISDIEKTMAESIIAAIGDGISIKDKNYKIIYQNQVHKDIFGDHSGEICYKAYMNRESLCEDCTLEKSFNDGQIHTAIRSAKINGKLLYTEITSSLLRDSAGEVIAGIEVIRDISHRRQIEEALRESEEKFRTLAERSPNMIFINQKGRIVYANEECERITGYSREELYAPDFDFCCLIAPDAIDWVMINLQKHLKKQEVTPYEYAILTKDGRRIEVINSTKLITFNRESAILGIVTDISQRTRAEKALRESKALFQSTIESLPFDFFAIGTDGRYFMQNSICKETWGDITGKRPQDLPVSKEIIDDWLDTNRRVFSGEIIKQEFELPVKGKTSTYFNIMAPIKNEDQILGLLGVNIDITKRKQAVEALKKSEADFQMLAKIGADVVGGKDNNESLQQFTASLMELLHTDRGWLFEVGECKGIAKYISWKEGWQPSVYTVKYDAPDDIHSYIKDSLFKNPDIVNVFDFQDEPILSMDDPEAKSLLVKSELIYMFTSYSGKKWACGIHENTLEHRAWTEHEKLLLKQASHFANLAISQKESRDALEASEKKILGITNTASDAIVVIDDEGKITFWNPAAEKIFGYSTDEVMHKELHAFLAPPKFHGAHEKGFSRFKATGKGPAIGKTLEFKAIKKDGTVFPIEVSTSAIKINDKWHSTGIIRDITERKKAEQRQVTTLHYFMSMHQISEIIEQTMDVEKMIQEVVEKLLIVFSCDRAWLLYPCDPDSPTWKLPVVAAVPEYPNPVPTNVEMPMDQVMADTIKKISAIHTPVTFSPKTNPLLDEDEYELQKKINVKSALVVVLHTKVGKPWELGLHQCSHEREWTDEEKRLFQDISYKLSDAISNMLLYQDLQQSEIALQAAKEELERQNQELKALDKMKDGLIRDATHELKTPVAKQGMQLDILKLILEEHDLSDKCAKVINTMRSSISRQDSVINNILDLSRLEAGGRKFRSERMRLDLILNSVIDDYQTTLEAHNIKIKKDLPKIIIVSDQEMLFHVFSNLINNAIKYRSSIQQPEIIISMSATNEKVTIKVIDNGIGMTEDAITHAFDKFYQASISAEGSGVGLSIAKMITEGLTGSIRMKSAGTDQGLTAVVELPINIEDFAI